MLEFQKINEKNAVELAAIYRKSDYRICDYSIGVKLMWKNGDYRFAFACGCLIVGATWDGEFYLEFPVPVDETADIEGALKACAAYCAENFLPLNIDLVPQSGMDVLTRTFRQVTVTTHRSFDDYLYLTAELAAFEGKKYAGQRNHIRKFFARYPNAKFEEFTAADKPRLYAFFDGLGAKIEDGEMREEWSYARGMVEFVGEEYLLTGGFTVDGEVVSFCLGEVCGDTLVEHIEKARSEYEGVYPATVQAYAKQFGSGVKYINREDDAGSRGLRISKMQYQPTALIVKRVAHIVSPLEALEEVPTVCGENGVALTPITEEDIPDYYRLCTDEKRNELWGYDYREACPTPTERYFYDDQREDFNRRVAMNWAIRKDGKFLGEVILYNLDCQGGGELGVRILPEADGQGLGREAYRLAAEYALYNLDLLEVRGKCFKNNLPSVKMLTEVMRKTGEDEIFYYYRRVV